MATTINHTCCVETLEAIRADLTKERSKETKALDERYRRQLERIDERIRAVKDSQPK
jgi:uncharacterized protein YicC (UPF0701 family)